MTKKNYIAIGTALKAGRSVDWELVGRIADVFETDNSRFDRDRFMKFVAEEEQI